jgi:hypothetical protein
VSIDLLGGGMSRRFNRTYELQFGSRSGSLRSIKELRIKFRVEKSDVPTPNTAQIEIYNLSETSRNELQGDDMILNLAAGYEENQQGLFFGDVTKVEHRRMGADRVTIIEAGDGQRAINQATISKSYAKGTPITQVIKDVIGTFKNINFSQVIEAAVSPFATLNSGGSFEGASDNVLTDLLSSFGLNFSIQDGEMIVAGAPALLDTDVQIVSAATGLIESPSKTDKGIAFQMLLEPRIRPGSIISLASESVSGAYKAKKVIYEGDNFDRPWYTSVEAEAL